MAGEKIKLSENNKLYDIQKISTKVDNMYNNIYVRNIKDAINSSNSVINYLNAGKLKSAFTEINASKYNIPQHNANREKFVTADAEVEITDNFKLNKDVITGKEAANYFKDINKFIEKTNKYIDAINNINEDTFERSIKAVDKLIVYDKNKLYQMNLEELNFQSGLNHWIQTINSWVMFGVSYNKIFISIMTQIIKSSEIIIDKAKTLTIKMNKEKEN